jgi:uncharacterized protein (DUF983 family)
MAVHFSSPIETIQIVGHAVIILATGVQSKLETILFAGIHVVAVFVVFLSTNN